MKNRFATSEGRLICFAGQEAPRPQLSNEAEDMQQDIEQMKQKETAEQREKRVSRWLGLMEKTNRLLEIEKVESKDGGHEQYRFYQSKNQFQEKRLLSEATSKGKEFDQAEFMKAAIEALTKIEAFHVQNDRSKQEILLRDEYHQHAALEQLRSWLRKSEPKKGGFSSSDYDIGKPKDPAFGVLAYGLYHKDGRFISNVTERYPRHMQKDSSGTGEIVNPSGFYEYTFKQLAWMVIESDKEKQERKK